MKIDFFFKLSLNVIAVFLIAIMASFIPDMFHEFFGDWHCEGSAYKAIESKTGELLQERVGCTMSSAHEPEWHWGYRHYLWAGMGFLLFVVQCFRIGVLIDKTKI